MKKTYNKKGGFDGRTKICKTCNLQLSLENFNKQSAGLGGVAARCSKCAGKIHKEKKWGIYREGYYSSLMKSLRGRVTVMHASIAHRARCNKVRYELTREWYEIRLAQGICEVTGIPFQLEKMADDARRTNAYSPSVDRIDPKLGYTPQNSRMTILAFNMLKSDATDQQVRMICAAIVEISGTPDAPR